MTQTYRTNDGARWGTGKGSDLTPHEVDINFWDLIQRMIAQETRPDPGPAISSFEVTGTSFYVHFTDGSVLGPYVLPVAEYRSRGEWAPSESYAVLDTFTANGSLYQVLVNHVSGTTFDPNAVDGSGNPLYATMLSNPGNALPTGGATDMVLTKATGTDFEVTWQYPLPDGGGTRDVLVKQSNTTQDADWEALDASKIPFTPVEDSALVSDNVADALEELSAGGGGGGGGGGAAVDITVEPNPPSLTATDVQFALVDLANRAPVLPCRETLWIPATAMVPRITNGPASNTVELATNKNMVKTLDFDATVREYAQFDIVFPKSASLSDGLKFKVFWSHISGVYSGDTVTWVIDASTVNKGFTMDNPFGGAVTIVAPDNGGGNGWNVSDESSAMGLSGTGTVQHQQQIRISRDPTHASDNLNIDARLHGVLVFYQRYLSSDT